MTLVTPGLHLHRVDSAEVLALQSGEVEIFHQLQPLMIQEGHLVFVAVAVEMLRMLTKTPRVA